MTYTDFADKIVATNIISDPWINGHERFRLEPILLSRTAFDALWTAAEALAGVFDELSRIVWNEPELLDTFFSLTPYQKLMWFSSGGFWHGIARFDLFCWRTEAYKCAKSTPIRRAARRKRSLLIEFLRRNFLMWRIRIGILKKNFTQ